MRKTVRLLAACLALLLLPSCVKTTTASPVYAFDTVFTQTIIGGEETPSYVITGDEYHFSRTDPKAELYRFNEAGGGEADRELAALLNEAMRIAEKTDGAFDFTLAPVSDLWDFPSGKNAIPSEAALAEALAKTGYERVTRDGDRYDLHGTSVDLGGIAKGYEIGNLIDIYRRHEVRGAIVSCSSSVGVYGEKANGDAFQIGIRDPNGNANDILGVLTLQDSILSTSGDYERCFLVDGVRYHHILDPETGYPVQNGLRSVTVVSPLTDAPTLAGSRTDALATALFVLGRGEKADALLAEYGMEAIFVTDDGIFLTAGLNGKFTTERPVTVLD